MGVALTALLAVLPWLSLTPLAAPGVAATVLAALTVVAACHAAGQAVALGTRRRLVEPALALLWGVALLIVIGGWLTAAHLFTPLLVGAFAGLHTVIVVRERETIGAWLDESDLRWCVPAAVLLAVVAVIQLVGVTGSAEIRPFDDDGHVGAQTARLLQTGALGDGIGFARTFQLGGNVVFGALAGDASLAAGLDRGVAYGLLLALVCVRIRPQDACRGMWAAVAVLAMSAFAFVPGDSSPCWIAAALLVTLYVTVEDGGAEAWIPIAIVAAALTSLRLEFAPAAVTGIVAIAVSQQRALAWRVLGLTAGLFVVLVLPFVIARALAAPDHVIATLIAPKLPGLAVRVGLFIGVLAVACPLLSVIVPLRWPAYATAAGIAGIVSQLSGDRPYATRFVWPIVIALVLTLLVQLARRAPAVLAKIVALAAVLLIYEGITGTGRTRVGTRYYALVGGAVYARQPTAHIPYERVLAAVPAGATVAVWVTEPEQIDYARNPIIDLRTPRTAQYREYVFGKHRAAFAKIARGAQFLLVERDDRSLPRRHNLAYRILCREPRPECADDLENLLARSRVVAEIGTLRIVALQ